MKGLIASHRPTLLCQIDSIRAKQNAVREDKHAPPFSRGIYLQGINKPLDSNHSEEDEARYVEVSVEHAIRFGQVLGLYRRLLEGQHQ